MFGSGGDDGIFFRFFFKRSFNNREIDSKGGSLIRLAVDRHRTAATLYNTVNHRQSQTGPRTLIFRGEKRIKDGIHYFRWYAVTGIADR